MSQPLLEVRARPESSSVEGDKGLKRLAGVFCATTQGGVPNEPAFIGGERSRQIL